MAKIYYNRIRAKLMTLDDVPDRWKSNVQDLLS